MKEQILAMIEQDRELVISFIKEFARRKSPNPPGNMLAAAKHSADLLYATGPVRHVISPPPETFSVVASASLKEPSLTRITASVHSGVTSGGVLSIRRAIPKSVKWRVR